MHIHMLAPLQAGRCDDVEGLDHEHGFPKLLVVCKPSYLGRIDFQNRIVTLSFALDTVVSHEIRVHLY